MTKHKLYSTLANTPFYHLVEHEVNETVHKYEINLPGQSCQRPNEPKSQIYPVVHDGTNFESKYTIWDFKTVETYAKLTQKGKYKVIRLKYGVQDGCLYQTDETTAKAKKLRRAIDKAKFG